MSGITSPRSQNIQFSSPGWKYKLGPQFWKVNRTFFLSWKPNTSLGLPTWLQISGSSDGWPENLGGSKGGNGADSDRMKCFGI